MRLWGNFRDLIAWALSNLASKIGTDRYAIELVQMLNPWPILDVRYDAAKASNLGDQLTAAERTERVQVELGNAFAAGALWQHGRYRKSHSKESTA